MVIAAARPRAQTVIMKLLFSELEAEDDAVDVGVNTIESTLSKAAEHLVAADILGRGHPCSMAAEGLRYDLIADINGLRRVQVKMSLRPNFRNPGKSKPYHRFGQTHGGYRPDGRKRRGDRLGDYIGDIDLFAFIALDKKAIIYALPEQIRTSSLKIAASDFTNERADVSWNEVLRIWSGE